VGFDCGRAGNGSAWKQTNGVPGFPNVGTNLPVRIFDMTPHP
jgi:hypothetical protein